MGKPIWPRASSIRVDRSLAAHTVMGLVISAILYIICVSGTLAVFEDELGWWERPSAPAVETVTPEAAQTAAENVLASDPDTTHLYLYLPRENWKRFVIGGDEGLSSADASGTPVSTYETPWNDFLIHLHYYLHLPTSFGMIIVAIFGVMMLGMAISGFLAHPRIFRDAFRLKRSGQARLAQADLHNRISVWTAPFHIVVAGTGAVIGLFVVVAFVLAQTSFGGDTRALSTAIFGDEPAPDSRPADLADIGASLQTLQTAHPDVQPFLAIIHDPGTAGQHIEIYGEHFDRLVYGETYQFSADGSLLSSGGNTDGEAGKQIANSVYRLHFGDFGGTFMKIAYFGLGVLMCLMVATGLNIYFLKQAEKGKPKPKLASAWSAMVWGAPALLVLTLLLSLFDVPGAMLTPVYWIGLLILSLAGLYLANAGYIGMLIRKGTGVAGVLTGLLHAAQYADTLSNPMILSCDLALFFGGVALLVGPFWLKASDTYANELASPAE